MNNWLDTYDIPKAQRGMHAEEHPEKLPLNFEGVSNAIRNVESLDGVLMMNPSSSATGLFGQRFSEIKNDYKGTRKDFSKDTIAQKQFFKDRFYNGLDSSGTTSLQRDANDLYKDYSPQFKDFDYSKEDLSVLSNFLGRQGTRNYLGEHKRDGKPLEEVFPNLYGENVKQANKTPEEYLKKARGYYQDGGVIQDNRGQWAHPGKVTQIQGDETGTPITMKGVSKPLIAISNDGEMRLLNPQEEHHFKGDTVTEYPLAQQGTQINNNWLDTYN